jgi:transcriptional regulator with XRE-family HTH domain
MGSNPRAQPERLAEKLTQIRSKLDLTQTDLAERLSGGKFNLSKQHISAYEKGLREPASIILLRYARLARTTMEKLIDDDLDLPR